MIAHAPAEIVVSDVEEFLSREGITSKAGCTWYQLPTLAIKEIVDNAFDFEGASYDYDVEEDEHIITDEGPGLGKEDILRLFNIRRPMTSTKRWRRAGRGALGNGLRVACAAVRLLEGVLTVRSRDGEFRVDFDEIGETQLVDLVGEPLTVGTEIRVRIGGTVDWDIIEACTLAPGAIYTGPASPYAFGVMQFRELTRQCSRMSERQFAAQFGCDLGRDMPLAELDDKAIKTLHGKLRNKHSKNTTLPGMGEDAFPDLYFDEAVMGMVDVGGGSTVPATVEAWAVADRSQSRSPDAQILGLWMNRTVSFTKPSGAYYDGNISLRECGLQRIPCKAGKAYYEIALAITTSYFPMTSTGKAPDLSPFADLIKKAVRKACKLAYECADIPEKLEKKGPLPPKPKRITIVDAAFSVMDDAVKHQSDGFTNVITARQAFYAVRSLIKERFPTVDELQASYFTQDVLPAYMKEFDTNHWPVINYDGRGSASYPHDGEKNLQLSTVGVSKETRFPPNLEKITAVLFVEKEQFSEIIGPVQNEFDLLLLEAKGQGTVAEKVLMKWASDAGLPVFVFADCDIAGHMIEQTIREGSERFPYPIETAERIGLNLEDAKELGLMAEPCSPQRNHKTWLASSDLDDESKIFLRNHRFELNHLSTGQMRELLRRKLTEAGIQKAMPGAERLMAELELLAQSHLSVKLTEELEEEYERKRAELDARIECRVQAFGKQVCDSVNAEDLHKKTKDQLSGKHYKATPWRLAFTNLVCDLGIISEQLSKENQ